MLHADVFTIPHTFVAGSPARAAEVNANFDAGELRTRIEVGHRMLEIHDELAEKIGELQRALAEIRTRRGIVPI